MPVPSDVTIPGPNSSAARRVFGAYLKRTASDLLRWPLTRFDARVAADFAAVRRVLVDQVREKTPGALFGVLRRPTVSTLVRCIDAELWGEGNPMKLDAWLSELTTLLAWQLAASGELPDVTLWLHRPPPCVLLPSERLEVQLDPTLRVGFQPRRLLLERDGSRQSLPVDAIGTLASGAVSGLATRPAYHPIRGQLLLALADNNPLRSLEAHPDKSGNRLELGEQPVAAWTAALGQAHDLIEQYLPELTREMELMLELVVPVGYDPERHLSASYAEAIGMAYLSLHPDPMTMAEALIHEFSHNKLNALLRNEAVLKNAQAPLFSSPVRPDPRPLHGVLLAAHAFLPVARLYERLEVRQHPFTQSAAFSRRFEQITANNHDAVSTLLEHGDPTEAGRQLLDELAKWDQYFQRRR